jgi:phosphoglycolate phosphatase-like HAD superfamily hydrolase
MVGDDMRDVNAGLAAGCKTALLSPESTFHDLASFVQTLPELQILT